MSKTGRYVWGWDEEKQKMTWILKDTRVHAHPHVYFPGNGSTAHSGVHFENCHDKTFHSAQEKRNYMKEHGLAEAG